MLNPFWAAILFLTAPAFALGVGEDDVPAPGSPVAVAEQASIREIARLVLGTLEKEKRENPNGLLQRDAHPKAHGCVKATFTPLQGLPLSLAQGVFKHPKPYPAWIRYSNGSPSSSKNPDSKGDARGMAIKLMGVGGGKLLDGDEKNTQDFLVSNHPVFFIRSISDYLLFMKSKVLFFGADAFHAFHTKNILDDTVAEPANNPFELTYYSQTPYRLGPESLRQAVKYRARPVPCGTTVARPTQPSADFNFLRKAMIDTMRERDVCFEFGVQLQKNPVSMPISDSTVLWNEGESEFVPVARIRIPQKDNDGMLGSENERRTQFCENVAMTPWHGISEHRPMGGINRVRRLVYVTLSQFRRAANGVTPFEPTGREPF